MEPLKTALGLIAGEGHSFFRACRADLQPVLRRFIDFRRAQFPPVPFEPGLPLARSPSQDRQRSVARARQLFDATLSGRTEAMAPLLADQLWVVDRDGQANYTTKTALLAHLETTRSESKRGPKSPRNYSTTEIRGRWPSPVGIALESLLGGRPGLYVVAHLGPGSAGLLFVGDVAHSFLLPAWDGPVAASAPISSDEHDGVRTADRLARALTLGLTTTVYDLRTLIAPRVLWANRIVPFQTLVNAASASAGPASVDIGFLGTRRLTPREIVDRVDPAHRSLVEQDVEATEPDQFPHLGLTWCETERFRWSHDRIDPMEPIHILTLRRREIDVRGEPIVRHRVAGVFVPDDP